jgi:hypothetical protein
MSKHPPLIVYTLLNQLGLVGGNTGWGISYVKMPAGAGNNKYVTCKGTTAVIDGSIVVDKVAKIVVEQKREAFQIRVRSTSYDEAWYKSEAIREALLGILEQTIVVDGASFLIHNFQMITDITYIGQEETANREHFTSNWLFTVSEF